MVKKNYDDMLSRFLSIYIIYLSKKVEIKAT